MTQIASSVSHQSPLSSRRKVPAEPNSSNSSNNTAHSSPRQSHPTVSAVFQSRGSSLSPRRRNVIDPCSSGDAHRSPSNGVRKRIKAPTQLESPQQVYMEIGLENLGNTCFMNSSLQCLLHIQPLVSYFLVTDIDKVLNDSSPMKGLLASSFAQLVREIFNASAGSSVAPVNFQKVVSIKFAYTVVIKSSNI